MQFKITLFGITLLNVNKQIYNKFYIIMCIIAFIKLVKTRPGYSIGNNIGFIYKRRQIVQNIILCNRVNKFLCFTKELL